MRLPRARTTRPVDPEEVADAAVDLALRDGLHAVTAAAVAGELDVPAGRLAEAGCTDDALAASAFTRIAAKELAEFKRLVLGHPTPTAQLRVLLTRLAAPERTAVDVVWSGAWGLGRRNALLGAAVRAEEGAWHAFLTGLIRRGVRCGDFPEVDADRVAAQLLAAVEGVNAYALVGWRTEADRLRLLATVTRAELGVALDGPPVG